jgi:polysaccharide export outer membrane protein
MLRGCLELGVRARVAGLPFATTVSSRVSELASAGTGRRRLGQTFVRAGFVCVLALLLAGCFIAKDGPTGSEIRANSEVTLEQSAARISYALVKVSPQVVEGMNAFATAKAHGFASATKARARYSDVRIGVGDLLGITIFEASAGGLFIPQEAGSRAGNFVQIPAQQVDGSGNITVPYGGTIRVVGRTAADVSRMISEKLSQRAIEPQVVVSINERRGNDVSVLGEVKSPARFSLDPGGITLLGAIARAGGPTQPTYETAVTVQRAKQTHQAAMSTIVKNPAENITLVPGDVVYVSKEPRSFMVLGATPTVLSTVSNFSRKYSFDEDNVTLADAIARGNGLDSLRADSSSIFLFRFEQRDLLAHLGVDVSKYAGPVVPTVYAVNFTRADGLFLANAFYLKHRDIVYVSDSPSTDLLKFVAVVRQVVGAAGDIGNAGNSFLDWKAPR